MATSGAATTSRRLAADQLAAASGETGQPFDKTCEVQLVSGHMPTTISQSFSILKSNLEVTGLQQSTVSTRQNSVRSVMEAGMTVKDSFLSGSYSRSTMIAPLAEADIDIFTVLDPRYFHFYDGKNGGPSGLLDFVKRTLRRTYTKTPDISRSGQAVTIRFTDFAVDVVPGFVREGGGYLIPDSVRGQWLSTDPKKHVEIFAAANRTHNGNLVPVIKMLKAWNKNNRNFFRSFHVEVLALETFTGITISDFPSGVRFFFDKARNLVTQKNLDPAGYGDDIGRYLNTREKINEAGVTLQLAYERAVAAEGQEQRGLTRSAIESWSKLFGDYFPAYG